MAAIESGCAGAYSNYPRAEKDLLLNRECTVEVEEESKPALVANWKLLRFPGKDTIPGANRKAA